MAREKNIVKARRIAAAIRANTDAYWNGDIDRETFSANQRMLWDQTGSNIVGRAWLNQLVCNILGGREITHGMPKGWTP